MDVGGLVTKALPFLATKTLPFFAATPFLGPASAMVSKIMPLLSGIPVPVGAAHSMERVAVNFEKALAHRRAALHSVMTVQVYRARKEEQARKEERTKRSEHDEPLWLEDARPEDRRSSRSHSANTRKHEHESEGWKHDHESESWKHDHESEGWKHENESQGWGRGTSSARHLKEDFESFMRLYEMALEDALADCTDDSQAKRAVRRLDNEMQATDRHTRVARAFAKLPRKAREAVSETLSSSSIIASSALTGIALQNGINLLVYGLLAVYVAKVFSSNARWLIETLNPSQILSKFGMQSAAEKAAALEKSTSGNPSHQEARELLLAAYEKSEQEEEHELRLRRRRRIEEMYRGGGGDISSGDSTVMTITRWAGMLSTLAGTSAVSQMIVFGGFAFIAKKAWGSVNNRINEFKETTLLHQTTLINRQRNEKLDAVMDKADATENEKIKTGASQKVKLRIAAMNHFGGLYGSDEERREHAEWLKEDGVESPTKVVKKKAMPTNLGILDRQQGHLNVLEQSDKT